MEKLAKMSEKLQIIYKIDNNYSLNNKLSDDFSNKTKNFITSDTNK